MIDHLLGFGLFFLFGGLVAVTGGLERRRQKRAVARRAVRVKARVVAVNTSTVTNARFRSPLRDHRANENPR